MGLNGVNQINQNQRVDEKELQVAKILDAAKVCSIEEFLKMTDEQKKQKVEEYNRTHPNNPIADKDKRDNAVLPPDALTTQQTQGSIMNKFMNDVDWKKIKLS